MLAFLATLTGFAQTNLTNGKQVYPLGGLKDGISLESLQLITAEGNTTNVYLLPEPSEADTPIQGFYIDLGEAKSIGAVQSTWEGADCGANIYVTNTEPAADGSLTGETKIAEFSNAQEAAKNAAVAVENSGRYIVFVPTTATNYAWGVKIRTFVALEKEASVLTKLLVSPSTVKVGEATEMTFTPQDQLGLTMTGVEYSVTNATLVGNILTATAAGDVVVTATLGTVSVNATVKAIDVAAPTTNPTEPTDLAANVIAVYSAKYGKGISESNPGWGVGGGAPNPLYTTVEEAEIADGHKVVHVLGAGFNSRTAGGVGITTDYTKLHVAVYPFSATSCKLFGDNQYAEAVTVTGLIPGQWNYVEVDNAKNWPNYVLIEMVGESEFYLDHFYFAKVAIEDTQAPVLNTAELVKSGIGCAVLRLKATDDKSAKITYVITDQDSKKYTTKGDNGAELVYTLGGLEYAKEYTLTVVAQDDNENASESKVINVTTQALTAAPAPTKDADKVMSIYSNAYTAFTSYNYGAWGQSTVVTPETVGGDEMLKLTKYNYLGFEYYTNLDLSGMKYLHIDVLPQQAMTLGITPILFEGTTVFEKSTSVGELTVGEWNSIDLPLSAFGLDFSNPSHQLKIDMGSGSDIVYIDNIYFWTEEGGGDPDPFVLTAAPTPTHNETEDQVFSVFSDAYTWATPDGHFSNWGGGNPVLVQLTETDAVIKVENFNYVGHEFGKTVDLRGYTLHVDVLSTDQNTIGITPITQAGEKSKTFNVTKGEWTSLDIPATDWESPIDLQYTFQIKFDGGNSVTTLYLDNVYFWKKSEGGGGDPTPTSGEGNFTIPTGLNAGKVLNYTWAYKQVGMDVTVTYECTNKDEIIGIVDGYIFDKTGGGFVEREGLTYTWTNCTKGQVITSAHKWMFAEGEYVTGNFSYTVTESVAEPVAVHFVNGLKWDNVYAYSWSSNNTDFAWGEWPGTKIEKSGTTIINETEYDVYTWNVPAEAGIPYFVIFNDGTSGTGHQTADLEFVNGKTYDDLVPEPVVEHVYSIVGELTGGWDNDVDMTKDPENENLYTLKVDGFEATATAYQYKLRADHQWGVYEIPMSGNYTWNPSEGPAVYDLTFTFNKAENSLTLQADFKTGTGISDVRSQKADVRGEYYNLNGQRVAQPTHGLYIVNGRKMVVK